MIEVTIDGREDDDIREDRNNGNRVECSNEDVKELIAQLHLIDC